MQKRAADQNGDDDRMQNDRSRIELAYTILSGDDELDRVRQIISASQWSNLPRNTVINVVNGAVISFFLPETSNEDVS